MGQMFYACAYKPDNKMCCVYEADKFYSNCYSFSGAVSTIHYLLRQEPYHIMWGGLYLINETFISKLSNNDLLGLSTFLNSDYFNENIKKKDYYEKIKYIDDNSKLWNHLNVLNVYEESLVFFDIKNTKSVNYSGYLINHTKKLAIDLDDFYKKSISLRAGINITIDPISVLTETGGGTQMAFFNGITIDTTEELACTWCGDLLQIIDKLPNNFEIINCVFSEFHSKVDFCYKNFGVNENNFLLSDKNGTLFTGVVLNVFGKRGIPCNIEIEIKEKNILFKPHDSLDEIIFE
ncbi:MAG: hypothetical protein FWD47_01685 [Treponema sp.]|nr:hypothetical protein [Treponema sp.]